MYEYPHTNMPIKLRVFTICSFIHIVFFKYGLENRIIKYYDFTNSKLKMPNYEDFIKRQQLSEFI